MTLFVGLMTIWVFRRPLGRFAFEVFVFITALCVLLVLYIRCKRCTVKVVE